MFEQSGQGITIDPAPWWQPESHVIIKEEYTAADEAWVQNRAMRVQGEGKKAKLQPQLGEIKIRLIERMVLSGVVSTRKEKKGRTFAKSVNLPSEAGRLDVRDIDYINEQIDAWHLDEDEESEEDKKKGS